MRVQERLTRRCGRVAAAEIGIANPEHASEQLRAAFTLAVTTETGLTVLCCAPVSRQLAAAHKGDELPHKHSARNRALQSLKSSEANSGPIAEPAATLGWLPGYEAAQDRCFRSPRG